MVASVSAGPVVGSEPGAVVAAGGAAGAVDGAGFGALCGAGVVLLPLLPLVPDGDDELLFDVSFDDGCEAGA